MHFLIVAVLICLLFGRFLGGVVKAIFWLILVLIGLVAIGALVHG